MTMRFRLLRGFHEQGDKDSEGKTILYKPGDEFTSKTDLVDRFNKRGCVKFERLPDLPDPVVSSNENQVSLLDETGVEDDLDDFTIAELRQRAEDEGVNISGLRRKDEIIDVLRGQSN